MLSVKGRDSISDLTLIQSKLNKWIEGLEKNSEYIDREIAGLRKETQGFNEHINKCTARVNEIVTNAIDRKGEKKGK